jgi:predicted nucleic acid-binding protein
MNAAVVDASIAVKAVVDEGDLVAAQMMLEGLELHAPEFIGFEVANTLWSYNRRGLLSRADAEKSFSAFLMLSVQTVASNALLKDARALSFALDCPIYDCAYWALAQRLDVQFLTADARFVTKLRNAKVSLSRLRLLR